MLFDWLLDAIGVLGFRAMTERRGVWGMIWFLTGVLFLAALVILAAYLLL